MNESQNLNKRIALINMPFSSIYTPSFGLSLLSEGIRSKGYSCDILYLNLQFPKYIGLNRYLSICNMRLTALLGEWIFSNIMSDGNDNEVEIEEYFEFLKTKFAPVPPVITSSFLREIRQSAKSYLKDCFEKVDWEKYDIIGFTTTFEQNNSSIALAKMIKESWPNKHIIFGGANCLASMGLNLIKAFPFINAVCLGEGDISVPEYIDRYYYGSCLDDIEGIATQTNFMNIAKLPAKEYFVEDLDELPYSDYDDYFQQLIDQNLMIKPYIFFESSRGCWWGEKSQCLFCGLNGQSIKYRSKSQKRSLEEVKSLNRQYGHLITRIVAVDTLINYEYFNYFLPEFTKLGLGCQLFFETRANINRQQVRLFKEAGITNLQIGIESLNTKILKYMRKGTSMLQNIRVLKWAKEFGLSVSWNILYGFPIEKPEDYLNSIPLIEKLTHLEPPDHCGPFCLTRFSPLYNESISENIFNVRPYKSYDFIYPGQTKEILFGLAYYFEFDYAEPKNIEEYSIPLKQAVNHWQEIHSAARFFYTSTSNKLCFYDSRKGEAITNEIHDWVAVAYKYCDDIRTLLKVDEYLKLNGYNIDENNLKDSLDTLVSLGYMVNEGNNYLALAIKRD